VSERKCVCGRVCVTVCVTVCMVCCVVCHCVCINACYFHLLVELIRPHLVEVVHHFSHLFCEL
jgi:hypothetical protein